MNRFAIHGRVGLTLAELVAVLTILAVMATVAVQSVQPRVEQSRFDATQQTLASVEQAVLGPPHSHDAAGRPIAGGFVADLGRLPRVTGGDARFALAELWDNDQDRNGLADLMPFGIQAPAGDPAVRVAAGWRGPYLRLPIGARGLDDGWGSPLVVLLSNGLTVAPPGELAGQIVSLGADRSAGGIDFAADVACLLQVAGPAGFDRSTAELAVHVFYLDLSQNPLPDRGAVLICRVYGPDGSGRVTTLAAETATVTDATTPTTFRFAALSRGPRVVRVYQTATPPADDESPIELVAGSSAVSVPVPVMVAGQSESFILRDY